MIFKQGVYLNPQFYFRRMNAYKQFSISQEMLQHRDLF